MSLNSVTVGAANLAQRDFRLGLHETLAIANIPCFRISDVVKVECDAICVESTIDATNANFVCVEPTSQVSRPLVRFCVDALAISGRCKALLAPDLIFRWLINAIARFTIGIADFIRVSLSPTAICLTLATTFFLNLHGDIIS